MLDKIAKQSISTLLGLLVGFLVVVWVEPTTNGGTVFLVLFCGVISNIVGIVIKYLTRRKTAEGRTADYNADGK